MKKAVKIFAIVLGIIILAMVAVPFLFKGQIVEKIKKVINEKVEAQVDFDNNISLSLFRSFPNLNLGLNDLSVVGKERYEGDTLLYSEKLQLVLNVRSLFNDETEIKSVSLSKPFLQLLVDSSGHANWEITKEEAGEKEEKEAESSAFKVALQKYELREAHIIYSDSSSRIFIEAKGLDHTGKGDFTQDIFDLDTKSKAKEMTFSYAGIPYLNRLATDMDVDLNIDLSQSKYTLNDNTIKLNGLTFDVDGYVALPNETDTELDLKINADEADFKNFLSLIPAVYQKNFEDLEATGDVAFDAYAKGIYNEERMPAFGVDLTVKNGHIKYSTVPEPLSEVNLSLLVKNEDGDLDHTFVSVKDLHFLLGKNPFDAYFIAEHIQTNPYIDGAIKGKLDLADVTKIYPLEKGTQLAGILDLDLKAKGDLNAVSKKQYDKISLQGTASTTNLLYKSEALEKQIKIPQGHIAFTEQNADIKDLRAEVGESAVDVNALIRNIQSNPYLDGRIKGNITLADITQIYPLEKGTELSGKMDIDVKAKGDVNTIVDKQYDQIGLDGNIEAQNIVYNDGSLEHPVKIPRGQLHFTPQQVKVNGLETTIGKSDIRADGGVDNLLGYAFSKKTLTGNLAIRSNLLDLNDIMGEEEASPADTSLENGVTVKAIAIPRNIQFALTTDINQFYYSNYDLKNLKGQARIADGVLTLQDLSTSTLDGQIRLAGTYDPRDIKSPKTDIQLKVKDVDIQKTFQAFNTVKQLAPIARLTTGRFSGDIDISTLLDSTLHPMLKSVNALSGIQLSDFDVKGFKPLMELAEKLHLDHLSQLDISSLFMNFKIKDGFLNVEPFTFSPGDIDIQVAGRNGLNKEIDYTLDLNVPRDKLGKIDATLANLVNQANKTIKGDLDLGEKLPVTVRMTGTIDQPKIALDFSKGKEIIEAQLKEEAKSQLQKGASKLLDKISGQRDTTRSASADEKSEANSSERDAAEKDTSGTKKEEPKKEEQIEDKLKEGLKKGLNDLFNRNK